MNSLFTAIYNKFTATTTGFYNDVSGRMYLYKAPQDAPFPYCVYFPVSDLNDVDFSDETEEFLVQFNVFSQSNSATEAGTLLASLKTLYDDCDLTVTGWRHLEFSRGTVYPLNNYDKETTTYGYAVEYDVTLEQER